MTQNLTLNISERSQTGRSASRRVRKANQIPAILYGKHTNPRTLAVDAPEFTRLVKAVAGRALIIELKDNAGANALSFVQEIQRDPITDRYLHVDLQEVKANEKVDLDVPVSFVGEAHGVKTQGGVLEIAAHKLRIRCLPKDLPPVINVDITELKLNETIKVGGLKPIPGVEFRNPVGQPVVGVLGVDDDSAATATPAAGAAPAAAAPAAKPGAAAPAAKPGAAAPAAAKPAAKK